MKSCLIIVAVLFTVGVIFTEIPASFLFVASMVTVAIVWIKINSNEKSLKQTIREIDLMTGEEFEFYVAKIFRNMGYKAEVTKTSGDYGADVVASRLHHGKKEKAVIQCKRYQGKVGISAVQEVVGAKAHYDASKAFVVTNSHYTDAAKNLAHSNKVTLWDRDTLQAQLKKLVSKQEEEY